MNSVDEFREALLGQHVRVEFAPTLNLTSGGMVETARVYVKNEETNRWRKVDPLLLPQEGGDRAALLADLAMIAGGPSEAS